MALSASILAYVRMPSFLVAANHSRVSSHQTPKCGNTSGTKTPAHVDNRNVFMVCLDDTRTKTDDSVELLGQTLEA